MAARGHFRRRRPASVHLGRELEPLHAGGWFARTELEGHGFDRAREREQALVLGDSGVKTTRISGLRYWYFLRSQTFRW
jgi:hypothetical protein